MTDEQSLRDCENIQNQDRAKYIVAIGASAGGLDALIPVVSRIEPCGNSAFIIARHMSSDHGTMLSEILSGYASIPVITAVHGTVVKPDTIYVIPPGYDAEVSEGCIVIKTPYAGFHSVPSVDMLFKSVANSLGEYSAGVILSGAGSDGTEGAAAIKSAGGIVIVQKPEDAINSGMPYSAINEGFTDFQLTASEIGEFLNSIGDRAAVSDECNETYNYTSQENHIFIEILGMVAKATNMDVSQYKEATLRRQIKKRILAIGLKKIGEYLDHIKENPEELTILQHSFLISVTAFFRDSEPFSTLEKVIIDLVSGKQSGDSIRIWVPGCATGEEAYSISIIVNEVLGGRTGSFDIRIFATDIDAEAIAMARAGIYPANVLENMDPVRKEMWFTNEGRNFRVKKAIRDICIFSVHDVICHPPFIRMDIVSCRNLLIYLKPSLQDSLISNFHYALNPDGYLLLGKSESTGHTSRFFDNIDITNKIFKRKASAVSYPIRLSGRTACIAPVIRPAVQSQMKTSPFIEITRDILVAEYAPSSVLVNQSFDVLHFFGNAKRYLSLPEGTADFSLFSLCLPEICVEMKTLCYRASRSEASKISGLPAKVCIDGNNSMLQLTLRRIQIDHGRDEYAFLVSFEEYPDDSSCSDETSTKSAKIPDEAADEIARLRYELAETREHLQTVVEALESSNEELQSLNEEQQASSEELQSSNEELQSSNEELTTLNDELRLKSIELANLNSILANVQNSIQMGLVVVDREGRITRFNALAVRVFGIMKSDIGQHLAGIPRYLDLPCLREQIQDVISEGASIIEKTRNGLYHYLMQISPSMNESGQCIGAVLTFTDISAVHIAEEALKESQRQAGFLASMLENSSQPFAQGFSDGRFGICNRAFLELTGYTRDDLASIDWVNDLTPPEWLPVEREKLDELNETGSPVRYKKEYVRKNRSVVPVELLIHLVRDDSGQPVYYYSFITDITERLKTEEALRISEQRFRKLVEEAPDSIFIHTNGRFVYVNETAVRLFGASSEKELIGKPVIERFHPDCRPSIIRRMDILNNKRQAVPLLEEKILRMDGIGVFVEASAIPFSYNSENGALVFVRDITERKLANNMINEREKQLSAVTKNYPGLVSRIDSDLCFMFVNKGYEKLYGMPSESIRGRTISEIMGNDVFMSMKPYMEKALSGRQSVFESVFYNSHGEAFHALVTIVPDRDSTGSDRFFFIFAADITERKKTEDALLKSEELLKSIIDNANGIIWLKDPEGKFLMVNRYTENRLGLVRNEITGKTVFDIFPEDTARQLEANDKKVLETGHAMTFEESARIDGNEVTFLSIRFPLFNQNGAIYALGAICTDITEHRNLIDEKNRLHEQFLQSQKLEAVGRLAGGVAHDFNNMLAAITGFSELAMYKTGDDESLRKDLSEILKAAGRASELVQQLMTFARKQNVQPMTLDLNLTISGMLKMLERLIGEDIDLAWRPGKELWQIKMDPSQLDQIIANLAINARDAITGNGKIVIMTENTVIDSNFCSRHPEITPGEYVLLSVADNGCGMDRETINNIFEPFYTTKEFGHGTGLGLATVYGIVRQNSGAITVQSEEGAGTTFRIYFPGFMPECKEPQCGNRSEIMKGQGETILLVEDEKAILNVGKMMLENIGYRVITADSPAEAILLAQSSENRISLMITDVIMPEMNGRELADRVLEIMPDIKILFMSGYTANIIANRGVIDGELNFIQKPFSLSELAQRTYGVLYES